MIVGPEPRWWAVQKLCRWRVRKRKARGAGSRGGKRAGQSSGGGRRLHEWGTEAECYVGDIEGAALRTGDPEAGGTQGAKSLILGRVPSWRLPKGFR